MAVPDQAAASNGNDSRRRSVTAYDRKFKQLLPGGGGDFAID